MPNCLFLFGVFLFLIGSLLYNTLSEPYAEEVNYAFSFLAVSFLTLFYSFFQKSEKCKITILDVGLIGFVIYALTRLCIHDVSYFSSADICKWGTAIMLYVLVRGLHRKAFMLSLLVCMGLVEAITVILQHVGCIEGTHTYFAVTGHLGNSGPTGGYLAVCLILSLHLFKESPLEGRKKWIVHAPIVVLLFFGLFLSDSRAAWLGFLVASLTTVPYLQQFRTKYLSIGLLFLLLGTGLYFYRPLSADARLLIGKVAVKMIADKPLLGHGVGAFPHKYMLYQAAYFDENGTEHERLVAGNVACAFNELLHLAVETGVVGCMFLLFIAVMIWKYGKDRKVKGGLLVWGIFSLFSYPVSVFPLLLLLFMLLGCLDFPVLLRFPFKTGRLAGMMCCLLACVYSCGQVRTYQQISENWSAFVERGDTVQLQSTLACYPQLRGNMTYHLTFLRKMVKESTDVSQKELVEGIIPSSDTYVLLGKYYQRIGNRNKAEETFILASQMVPNRLMPTYNLWKFYLENRDTVKAVRTGNALLLQPVKVINSFILNARNEVGSFIQNYQLEKALNHSGNNRNALEVVIHHYDKHDINVEKKKAAIYLIINMIGHSSSNDNLLDAYAGLLKQCGENTQKEEIYRIWNLCCSDYPLPEMTIDRDLKSLDANYLIDNIDRSYDAWKKAPWHGQVSFDTYCQYILPYRINTERLSTIGWRDTLSGRYYPLIRGEKNVKKAFAIINQYIIHHFRNTQPDYPRQMDALSIGKIRPGNCSLRCLYTIYVLRALGIPACYDFVNYWSNYSTRGHSWVTLVTHPDSTFTLHKGDSLPLFHNRIDGSVFLADFLPEETYPYPLDSIKRVAQVFRYTFDKQNGEHHHEVTSQYGISRPLKMKNAPVKNGFCDISIFLTGKDWEVIKSVPVHNHRIEVESIGYDQLYLFTYRDDEGNLVRSVPAIFHSNGRLEYLRGDKRRKETVVAYRKYPLFIHQTETWCKMKGCIIEASNSSDFENSEILLEIKETPFLFSCHKVKPAKAYRYVRYRNTNRWATALAEFEVYGKERMKGRPIGSTYDEEVLARGVDRNYLTFVTSYGEDYWYGLDLGNKPSLIERVRFLPKNDANFIEPGHKYEMLYYDNRWISLGMHIARCDSLVYEIPANSLTLVRDLTAGKEERPFTYREHTPQWW